MKKILHDTTDDKGFILVYVMFMTTLAFIVLSASISMYRSELHITSNQLEQLKIDTLFQMTRSSFQEDIQLSSETENPINYHFPYGDSEVHYILLEENNYHLYIKITTNQGTAYSITNQLVLNNE